MQTQPTTKTVFVDRSRVTEMSAHRFAAEASELGLPPGHWPFSLETDLGNGQELRLIRMAGDARIYAQQFGCIELTIFND